MFGLGWIFLVSLCALVLSFPGQMAKLMNRLKGRNDLRVFEAIRSGKDDGDGDGDDDDQGVYRNFTGFEFLQTELIAGTSQDQFISGKDDDDQERVFRSFTDFESNVVLQSEVSKYQFVSGNDVRGFLKQPETKRFTVQELFVCPDLDYGDTQFSRNNLEEEKVTAFDEDSDHSPVDVDGDHFIHDLQLSSNDDALDNNDPGAAETIISVEKPNFPEDENPLSIEPKSCISVPEVNDQEKAEEIISVAEVNDQEKSDETISVLAEVNDQEKSDETISVADVNDQESAEETISVAEVNDQEKTEETISLAEVNDQESAEETISEAEVNDQEKSDETISVAEVNDQESAHSRDKTTDIDEEFIDSEPPLQNSSDIQIPEHNIQSEEMRFPDEHNRTEAQQLNQSFWDSDSGEEDDELDILLQHQNLVQQIKMEMRNSRIRCLPTISEECETPKMADDLKPLKIDEKLEYKDRMEEIQKFYKCYAEKMRKLDILNYQTLNAISFLQLKDSETFTLGKKSLFSSNKLLPLPSLFGNKLRRIYVDQAHKSISELSHNLEVVYVGQACLSWEILCWQYGKTKELLEYDARGHRAYNHVAGEFQQFQVLLQRFVEDEPYQGHRLQYYAKNRCILRSFLQVPALKDDCSKDKKVGFEEGTDRISLVKLSEIIKKTMHTFWEFLHADKDEAGLSVKVHSSHVDPADSELLLDVTTTHQKKERKLKEIQRSGNCIVKKFQKQQEGRVNENQAVFISRVELRLVAKVLGLPRLTRDHLVWCKKKLNNINIVGRKVSVEPSCLLFPS
ncbi:uncharacterized protein LOC116025632 isoform X1 [Ipomoea triloba]|uniref:uncharacterized protein LOC116025632 isoform X1 n=1 Tax=Ipomoea triloba TaxID=35885 RepID=UPI00125D36DF|nr:uncharacterized protein LOC116025632 isoform X1 [Ipomoea triloba]XP_031122807.1 uncharacterized protein LOC116025632 isoform X2 [Ipomoea triloba]XP_031122814.1 uncharacterized protein LOC116025632 isoform X1 [Ipomoea triloba]